MERIKLQGRAAELREKLKEYEIRAQNHVITIRDVVDPLDDIIDYEIERAEQAMISLKVLVAKSREAAEKLKKIDKALHG